MPPCLPACLPACLQSFSYVCTDVSVSRLLGELQGCARSCGSLLGQPAASRIAVVAYWGCMPPMPATAGLC